MSVCLSNFPDDKVNHYSALSTFSSGIKGGLSSLFAIAICHPLFTLKTLKMSGIKFSLKPELLYAGYKSNAMCDIANQSVAFLAFAFFSTQIMKDKPLSDGERFLGGLFSGAMAAPPLSMLERSMILQQVKKNSGLKVPLADASVLGIFKEIVKKEEVKGLFRGLPPTIFRESLNSCCFFGLSKVLAKKTKKYIDNATLAEGVSYFSAGMLAGFMTTPFDALKTSMQNQIGDVRSMAKVLKDLGAKNLFRGATERTATIGSTMFFLGLASDKLSQFLDDKE